MSEHFFIFQGRRVTAQQFYDEMERIHRLAFQKWVDQVLQEAWDNATR